MPRKKGGKAGKPIRPTIKVSGECLRKIVQYNRAVQEATAVRNIYMSGIQEALSVPNGWMFDMKLGAYIAPEKPTQPKKGK